MKSDLYKNFRKARIEYKNSRNSGEYLFCRGRYFYYTRETPYFKNPIFCCSIKFKDMGLLHEYVQNVSFILNKLRL